MQALGSEADYVFGSLGFLLVTGTLLGLSGIAGDTVILPKPPAEVSEDNPQALGTQFIECLVTIYTDCDRDTSTKFFSTITNVLDFVVGYLAFFFQLLTFQLPIPSWLNAVIVVPPASVLAYIGLRFARGGG